MRNFPEYMNFCKDIPEHALVRQTVHVQPRVRATDRSVARARERERTHRPVGIISAGIGAVGVGVGAMPGRVNAVTYAACRFL